MSRRFNNRRLDGVFALACRTSGQDRDCHVRFEHEGFGIRSGRLCESSAKALSGDLAPR